MNIDEDIKENLDINLNEDSNLYANNNSSINNNQVNLYSGFDSIENDTPFDILEIGAESDQGDINNNTDSNINLYTNIDNRTNENNK
ncbi:hypothetical protein ACDQ56_03245 [Fusobacterium animalis]|uniref:hypothetical protein n=1 Tax=Fusobacterium animalis TaxID=76859 RepID=UPI0035577263